MISRIDLLHDNKTMIIIDYFDIFDVDDDAWFCDKTLILNLICIWIRLNNWFDNW